MVGSGTVLADDPRLSARTTDNELLPRQPLRVIADGRLRTPPTARILSEPGGDVLFLTAAEQIESSKADAIRDAGGRLLPVATHSEGGLEPGAMLSTLAAEGIDSVLVEGGGMLLSSLVAANVIDFWQIWVAPKVMGAGRGVLYLSLSSPLRLGEIHAAQVGMDLLVSAFPLES